MGLVIGRDHEVAEFVGRLIGKTIVPPFTAIGVESGGRLVGGAVFNGFTGADINLTIGGVGCLRRGVMRAWAHYAFVQLGCRRVSMRTRASNARVHALARRCGFQIEGVKRRAYADEDGVLYGLLPEDFPWLNLR